MRKSTLLLLSVMLAFGLAACSSNSNSGSSGSPSAPAGSGAASNAPEGETVTLTFWRHDYAPEAAAFDKLIASFEEAHPNIKIDFQMIPND